MTQTESDRENNPTEHALCILTPTYNRADHLPKLYESLTRQKNKDFMWLVIDDGSEDGTKSLIEKWKGEETFDIKYIYKKNGGKHTALNLGFDIITEQLTFIVDSDDTLTKDAVEKILESYNLVKDDKGICGLVFQRGEKNTKIPIGDTFKTIGKTNWIDMRFRDGIRGDKAEVWVTQYLNRYRFPVYEDEKFFGEGYLWCRLGEKYDVYVKNDIIYECEYYAGGLTSQGRKLRIHCPLGGMETSRLMLEKRYPMKYRLKNGILYDCYSRFAQKRMGEAIKESGAMALVVITMLPGILLYLIWNRKYGD